MNKNTAKLIIFVIVMLIAVPGALVGFRLMSSFLAYFNSGADPASIFHGHALVLPEADQAQWASDDEPIEGEPPSEVQREELISAYWFAWDALARAYATGDTSDLPTYWGGAALTQVRSVVQQRGRDTLTHGQHHLLLRFFSDDGSVAVLRDQGFEYTLTHDRVPITLSADADIVMTLDNGFWRIRQYSVYFQLGTG